MKKRKKFYPLIRLLFYIIVGAFNTILIKPEDVGTWKNYIGYLLLGSAAIEIFYHLIKYGRNHHGKAQET